MRPHFFLSKKKKPFSPASGEANNKKFKPKAAGQLLPLLKAAGAPEKTPFVPDPFQLQAVEKLQYCDVLVSAPTGSGKTWIAGKAIEYFFSLQQRVWYASPLKALSNAKFTEFGQVFGPDNVGILTGDRKENVSAPLIVGTTEILRNQLYDAMRYGQDLPLGLVILDEAHYLGDQDRGVVWEETMIYLPGRVRLLLLSATIANEDELAAWLSYIRKQPCQIVRERERPVPLAPATLLPHGMMLPLHDKNGCLNPKLRAFIRANPRPLAPAVENTLAALDEFDLLPAIFFLKSRADCDSLLQAASRTRPHVTAEKSESLREIVNGFLSKFPFLRNQPDLEILLTSHMAAHHAGLLPHWKLLVEILMQNGLLKVIFSTSTMAAGVNFPARSVIITQSDRFTGQEFTPLSAGDLAQISGRAGRRGMDKVGFGILLPGPFQDLAFMAKLFSSRPEPIKSQLSINFSMVMNLLLSHTSENVRQMLNLSLAAWQKNKGPNPKENSALTSLREHLDKSRARCASGEEIYIRGRRYRFLLDRQKELDLQAGRTPAHLGSCRALSRGRIIQSGKLVPFAVLQSQLDGDNPGVRALCLLPERRLFHGHPKVDFIPWDEIYKIYGKILNLPSTDHPRALSGWFSHQDIEDPNQYKPLSDAQLTRLGTEAKAELLAQKEKLAHTCANLICSSCLLDQTCADSFTSLVRQVENTASNHLSQENAWFQFIRHLEFLRDEGFVDKNDRLTDDGLWASALRLNQPVLIAESIRQHSLPADQPALLAALLALFVDNRENKEGGHARIDGRLRQAADKMRQALDPMLKRLICFGFDVPVMPLHAAQAIYAWAQMDDLATVSAVYGGGEGDVAQLIYRVIDNLRQLANLGNTHPHLAGNARQAAELLLRPPVLLPV
ncbi:MAG: DEAD/DEAH box helicase [Desulfarculales bacterium]|nr:DEAD/DEAH box helicase [Desulfarculales bacterium]